MTPDAGYSIAAVGNAAHDCRSSLNTATNDLTVYTDNVNCFVEVVFLGI